MAKLLTRVEKRNHIQTLDLADKYKRFVYEDNLISKRFLKSKKALITTPIWPTFFSNNIVQDFQENSDDEVDERTSEEYLRDLDTKFHERALFVGYLEDQDHLHFNLCGSSETEDKTLTRASVQLG
ncbi:hypothetical protein Tco_1371215 [Tanacetum coccineum]